MENLVQLVDRVRWQAIPTASDIEWSRYASDKALNLPYWCWYCYEGACAMCGHSHQPGFPICEHGCRNESFSAQAVHDLHALVETVFPKRRRA